MDRIRNAIANMLSRLAAIIRPNRGGGGPIEPP